MITDKYVKRLEEFLNSELDDYGLNYSWEQDERYENLVSVKITKNGKHKMYVNFDYIEKDDDLVLYLDLDTDVTEVVREFDHTVKYFWMLISPEVFK